MERKGKSVRASRATVLQLWFLWIFWFVSWFICHIRVCSLFSHFLLQRKCGCWSNDSGSKYTHKKYQSHQGWMDEHELSRQVISCWLYWFFFQTKKWNLMKVVSAIVPANFGSKRTCKNAKFHSFCKTSMNHLYVQCGSGTYIISWYIWCIFRTSRAAHLDQLLRITHACMDIIHIYTTSMCGH